MCGSNPAQTRSQRIKNVGGRTRARTWDPLIKSQLLYQLSYAPNSPFADGEAAPHIAKGVGLVDTAGPGFFPNDYRAFAAPVATVR